MILFSLVLFPLIYFLLVYLFSSTWSFSYFRYSVPFVMPLTLFRHFLFGLFSILRLIMCSHLPNPDVICSFSCSISVCWCVSLIYDSDNFLILLTPNESLLDYLHCNSILSNHFVRYHHLRATPYVQSVQDCGILYCML